MRGYIPMCDWCGRRIINGSEWTISVGDFTTFCCCRKHAVMKFAKCMSKKIAGQVVFDVWDNPNMFRKPELAQLLRSLHADCGGSQKTTNLQFERAKDYIVRSCSDYDFATALADSYIEEFPANEEDL